MEATIEKSVEVPVFIRLLEHLNMMVKVAAFRAGLEMGVWEKIGAGYSTVGAVAAVGGWDEEGTRRLLNMLVSLDLLKSENGQYGLVPIAEWYLVPGKPTYMGNFLLHLTDWEGGRHLLRAIRDGKRPIENSMLDSNMEELFAEFFGYHRAAPEQNLAAFDAMWQSLGIEASDGMRVFDFACGSAIKTLALCRQHPGVHATLQDHPSVLAIASEIATKLDVGSQIELLPGDLRAVDFGKNHFDVVRVGMTLRYLGPDAIVETLRRVWMALKPGGVFVIEDEIAEEAVTQDAYWPLDALWLYVTTENGDTYTFPEWRSFLEKSGFVDVARDGSRIRAVRPQAA